MLFPVAGENPAFHGCWLVGLVLTGHKQPAHAKQTTSSTEVSCLPDIRKSRKENYLAAGWGTITCRQYGSIPFYQRFPNVCAIGLCGTPFQNWGHENQGSWNSSGNSNRSPFGLGIGRGIRQSSDSVAVRFEHAVVLLPLQA